MNEGSRCISVRGRTVMLLGKSAFNMFELSKRFPTTSWLFRPHLWAVFALGIAGGAPLPLTLSVLSTWLAEEGVSHTSIGLFSLVGLAYSLKFLWAPLIDLWSVPGLSRWIGRRRSWLLITQMGLIASLMGLSHADPATSLMGMAGWAVLVAFFSATQDVVIDGYRIELCGKDEQAVGGSMAITGYRVGMLLTGAGGLLLAGFLPWHLVYMAMIPCIVLGTYAALWVGEPDVSERLLHYTDASRGLRRSFPDHVRFYVCDPLADWTKRPGWLYLLGFIALFKLGDAFLAIMTNPFLLELGFNKADIAIVVKSWGLVTTLAGTFLGGWAVLRYGIYRALWGAGLAQLASNAAFLLLYTVGPDHAWLMWTMSVENLASGVGGAVMVAYLSALCNVPLYTATHYALLSALAVIGRTLLSAPSGAVVDQFGWPVMIITSMGLGVPGLVLLYGCRRWVVAVAMEEPTISEPGCHASMEKHRVAAEETMAGCAIP